MRLGQVNIKSPSSVLMRGLSPCSGHCSGSGLREESGYSNLSYLLFVLGLLVVLFLGYNVSPFYYSYYEVLGTMKAQAVRADVLSDDKIIEHVGKVIRKQGIPASADELKINRYDNKIVIELSYEEVLFVDFGGGYDYDLWTFSFNPRVEYVVG